MRLMQKGSLTVTLAMSMFIFLSFCFVLVEGARFYYLQTKADRAVDLAEFSVLSEYQQELLEHYGLLFLELDYEQGKEQIGILEQRIGRYLSVNAEELETTQIIAENFRRATDGVGSVFFRQAVELQKLKSGYGIFESFFENNLSEEPEDLQALFSEYEQGAEEILGEYVTEEGMPVFDISLPQIRFPSIQLLTEAIFGDAESLSTKSVNPEERIGKRMLCEGTGNRAKISVVEMQLFYTYLFEHFQYYGGTKNDVLQETLDYQLEYIISGRADDKSNLEDVMWRIFLLRAGGNYLFYHRDAARIALAKAEAAAIAGVTGNPALVTLVQEMLLICQAIEEGISETKRIFAGEKVPLYQEGIFAGVEFGYKEYLYLFLNGTANADKIYRSLDIIELEVRKQSGYENFRMDHCTDAFRLKWTYRFGGMFGRLSVTDGGEYEQTITAIFKYDI